MEQAVNFPKEIKFKLHDTATRDGGTVTGVIKVGQYGIDIFVDEYGAKESAIGQGGIVYLEFWSGELQLRAWPDITNANPTNISLEGALEELREDSEE